MIFCACFILNCVRIQTALIPPEKKKRAQKENGNYRNNDRGVTFVGLNHANCYATIVLVLLQCNAGNQLVSTVTFKYCFGAILYGLSVFYTV